MSGRLFSLWDDLRSSYWFFPGIMALSGAGLALAAVTADQRLGGGWMHEVPWLFANRPAGARELLSTIAGSMITVAGVTFSITIVAVATVTSQFGPRVINTFMRDGGNQITLGTFIATFIYCLLVLRTIQSADEAAATFVPQIAVLGGFLMALVSVAVLIYFIHHVPLSIHASHVVAEIGHDLVAKVDHVFPEPLAWGDVPEEDGPGDPRLPDDLEEGSRGIRSEQAGYIQHIDQDTLLEVAESRDLLVEVCLRPGAFVRDGTEIVRAYPSERVDEGVERDLRGVVKPGRRRTQTQDALFLMDELVEIAARALSPGVNDPFTAITCLDWMGAALARMARRPRPQAFRYDGRGRLRVLAPVTDFSVLAEEGLARLRPYVARDRNAALHMMGVVGDVMESVEREEDRRTLVAQADALLRGAETALAHEEDRDAVRRCHRRTVAGGGRPGTRRVLGPSTASQRRPRTDSRVDAPAASD